MDGDERKDCINRTEDEGGKLEVRDVRTIEVWV